jgi:hypothetical protein
MIEHGELDTDAPVSDIPELPGILRSLPGNSGTCLSADDIAGLVGYVVGQPEHVSLPRVAITSMRSPERAVAKTSHTT